MPEMTEALSTKPEEKEQEEAAGSGTDSEGDDSDIPELEETAGEAHRLALARIWRGMIITFRSWRRPQGRLEL